MRPSTGVDDERTDQDLLAAAPDDPEAFAELYRRHVDRLMAFAAVRLGRPEEVADLVAHTWLIALERAGRYDPARGEPLHWLYGIASNLLANQQRRRVREALATARLDARALLDDADIERLEARIQAASTATAVQGALRELPARHREVLLLVAVEGLTPATGAPVLGISPLAFRVRLSRARRALDAALAHPGPPPDPPPPSPPSVPLSNPVEETVP